MTALFATLPIQRPPRIISAGAHSLVRCDACLGTGELIEPPHSEAREDEMRCPACRGGGVVLRHDMPSRRTQAEFGESDNGG